MAYIKNHIPLTIGKRPGIKIYPEYITIHSTANPTSTALNERNWLLNPTNDRAASWHIAVDEKEAIEAIPLTEMAYHAGTSKGNSASIGIEICESGDRQKTLYNAVNLVAKMLKERGWGIDKLKRHYDWSGKICPRILSDNNWQGWAEFKNKVQEELNKMDNMTLDEALAVLKDKLDIDTAYWQRAAGVVNHLPDFIIKIAKELK